MAASVCRSWFAANICFSRRVRGGKKFGLLGSGDFVCQGEEEAVRGGNQYD